MMQWMPIPGPPPSTNRGKVLPLYADASPGHSEPGSGPACGLSGIILVCSLQVLGSSRQCIDAGFFCNRASWQGLGSWLAGGRGRIGEEKLTGFSDLPPRQMSGTSANDGYNASVLAGAAGEFQRKNANLMDVVSWPRASQERQVDGIIESNNLLNLCITL